jgi:hypothetical protein
MLVIQLSKRQQYPALQETIGIIGRNAVYDAINNAVDSLFR